MAPSKKSKAKAKTTTLTDLEQSFAKVQLDAIDLNGLKGKLGSRVDGSGLDKTGCPGLVPLEEDGARVGPCAKAARLGCGKVSFDSTTLS